MWYNQRLPLRHCTLKELSTHTTSKEQLDDYFREAQESIDAEAERSSSRKEDWYRNQFQARGTTGDRIAAAALQLSEPTFYLHMDGFSTLFDIARNDAHHFDAAVKALCAVWPRIMPPGRALRRFASQYFATLPVETDKRAQVLKAWYIEDALKRTYGQFLALAETCLKDKLAPRREKWLEAVSQLLNAVVEGQSLVIFLMVDKLGDPAGGISNKAYHALLDMLSQSSTYQHPLLSELEKAVFQKNAELRQRRYCVNIINQLVFNKDERKLALRCITVYLALLKRLIVEGSQEATVVAAVLSGLRRAIPYAGADLKGMEDQLDAIFTLARTGPFSQRVLAVTLVQQLVLKGGLTNVVDRWHRAFYELLLVSPKAVPDPSQLTSFFSLLYKCLRDDTNDDRVCAYVHRLLERCLFHAPGFICAALLLIGELAGHNRSVSALLRAAPQPAADTSSKATASSRKRSRQSPSTPVAGTEKSGGVYDPRSRDPQYAAARRSSLWTLCALTRHTHPNVVQLAVLLRLGREANFESHPLDDPTLQNFLTMMCNAASVDSPGGGGDDHAPKHAGRNDPRGVPVFRRQVHTAVLPNVSDTAFIKASPMDLDVGSLFMHRFAVQREQFQANLPTSRKEKKKKKKNNADEEGGDSDDVDAASDEDADEEADTAEIVKKLQRKSKIALYGAADDEEADHDGAAAADAAKPGGMEDFTMGDTNVTAKKPKKSKKQPPAHLLAAPNADEEDDDDFDKDFNDLDWGELEDSDDGGGDGHMGGGGDDDDDDDDGDGFTSAIERQRRGDGDRRGPVQRGGLARQFRGRGGFANSRGPRDESRSGPDRRRF